MIKHLQRYLPDNCQQILLQPDIRVKYPRPIFLLVRFPLYRFKKGILGLSIEEKVYLWMYAVANFAYNKTKSSMKSSTA